MSKILAFDQSPRNTGIAIISENSVIHTEFFVTKAEDFYRPDFLFEHEAKFNQLIKDFDPDLLTIEGTALGSPTMGYSMGALFGLYSSNFVLSGRKFIVSPPMRWKKIVTGRGDASKSMIKSSVLSRFTSLPAKGLQQDVYDAVGMAHFANLCLKAYLGQPTELSKPDQDLITGQTGTLNNSKLSYNFHG